MTLTDHTWITVNKGMAPVLISALRNATKYISERIEATEVGDVSDLEEYLIHLGNLEAEVREQYKALAISDPQMIAYEKQRPGGS